MADSLAQWQEAKQAVKETWEGSGRGKKKGAGLCGKRGKIGREKRVKTGESSCSELAASFPRLG